MPLLQTSPTTAQVEGVTRKAILDRFLRETGLGTTGTITGVSGGATTTFDDTARLKSSQFPSSDWVGGWARISKDAGGASAAPENEHSPITTYDPTTNGRITVNPAMTAMAAGDEYQLWRFPNPSVVKDFLDQCLQNDIYLPCWSVLSEVPDFDMEANNTTDWTASNATVTKITGTEPVIAGKRWLKVAATSDDGYARTASMNVEPGTRITVSAIGQVGDSATTGTLQLYDVTNSAEITSVSTTRLYPVRLLKDITIPSTCKSIQVRLITEENGKNTYWDEVIVYTPNGNDIALPWWVKSKDQVKGIFELNTSQVASDMYETTLRGTLTNKYTIIDNAFGRGQLRLVNRNGGGITKPLFILGIRNEVAYATDTLDYKRVDENLLMACLGYKVFGHLKQLPTAGTVNSNWIKTQYAEYEKSYKQLMRQQSTRLDEIITSTLETNLAAGNYQY